MLCHPGSQGAFGKLADAKIHDGGPEALLEDVVQELAATRQRCESLEERLTQLEDRIRQFEAMTTDQ